MAKLGRRSKQYLMPIVSSLEVKENVVIVILFRMGCSISTVNMPVIQHKYYSAICLKLGIVLKGKSGTEFSPLTLELHPSAQRCLTIYFTRDFAS
jgi:hypothetical protein